MTAIINEDTAKVSPQESSSFGRASEEPEFKAMSVLLCGQTSYVSTSVELLWPDVGLLDHFVSVTLNHCNMLHLHTFDGSPLRIVSWKTETVERIQPQSWQTPT